MLFFQKIFFLCAPRMKDGSRVAREGGIFSNMRALSMCGKRSEKDERKLFPFTIESSFMFIPLWSLFFLLAPNCLWTSYHCHPTGIPSLHIWYHHPLIDSPILWWCVCVDIKEETHMNIGQLLLLPPIQFPPIEYKDQSKMIYRPANNGHINGGCAVPQKNLGPTAKNQAPKKKFSTYTPQVHR